MSSNGSSAGRTDVPPHARGYKGFGGRIGRTASGSERWWPETRRARPGAPNIIVVLLDDMGYSDIGPFGSEIPTPTLDRLAATGVRLTNYHTTPVCSPARAAMITGINPHRAGFGSVANSDPGYPNLRLELADDVVALPEILRHNGYATFAVGKWHLTRDALMNEGASRHTWPLQRGFDRYYGTLEGANSFFHPNQLVSDNSPVGVADYPDDYYLTDDLTDHAIGYLKALRANDATKPFYLYVAHHAMHGPLGAKAADLERHRGRYDGGWDQLRADRFARQVSAGLFPAGTRMAPRNAEPGLEVPAWDSLGAEERKRYARLMEVYAAMVDNVDQNLGRLLDTVEALGELDNTIVIFTSDNGGTAEGGPHGTRSYFSQFIHLAGLPDDWVRDVPRSLEDLGGPRTMIHYPRGWGMASNTPFRLYKAFTHAGGVRVPFVLSWPVGLPRRDGDQGIRRQYQYVTDVLPTLLDLAGLEHPGERNGLRTQEIDGVTFTPVLADRGARSTHPEQYAEFGGHRGFYRDGWKAVTLHRPGTPFDDAEWQLYHVETDPTEIDDLAQQEPERLRELAAAWEHAAWENTVFPLPDRGLLEATRRPEEAATLAVPVRLLAGTPKLERYRSAQLIDMRSFTADMALDYAEGDEGVLLAHGDQGGGYLVWVEEGHVRLAYNAYGDLLERDGGSLAAGTHVIRLAATAIEAFRWELALSVDDHAVARLDRVPMLVGMAPFSGIDVGVNRGGPVHWALHERHRTFPFTGALSSVTYTPGATAPYPTAEVERVREVAESLIE